MVLTGADREAFLEALGNPPEPTDKLVAALRRHREFVASGDVRRDALFAHDLRASDDFLPKRDQPAARRRKPL
jgi:hypothetical protein